MRQHYLVRHWILRLVVGLSLVLGLPGLGIAGSGGVPDGGPGQGQGGEGLDTAIQQMFEGGVYGTIKVAENGDVYVVSRYGEAGKGAPDFSRASNDGAGTEVYRIPEDKLKNATDAELDEMAKKIRASTETTLGTSMVGGQSRLMSQTQDEVKDKLKKLQEAYKKGTVKFDTTAKTGDQLKAALKTDPDIDAKLKGIEELEKTKKAQPAPVQPRSRFGPKPLEISTEPSETTVATRIPTLADPNFYVGIFGGPSFCNVSPRNPVFFNRALDDNILNTITGNFTSHATTSTNMTGGLKLGAWGGCPSLPPWTKYVGVSADFSYQNVNLQRQTGYFMQTETAQGFEPVIAGGLANMSSASGSLTTLGLMFNGRYGFLPNPEVSSFGQLQPYLGVGPVLGIATLAPTFTFDKFTNLYGQQVNLPINESHKFSSQTSVFPALGVEAGLRYLPYRNVYLDVSYRFLYGQPSFNFSNANFRFNLDPTYSTHSLRVGAGLMF